MWLPAACVSTGQALLHLSESFCYFCFLLSPFKSFLGVEGRPHTMSSWYILCRRGRGPKQAKLPEKVKVFLKPDLPGEPLRDRPLGSWLGCSV